MCGGGKKRKNRVVSLILREGSTLWLLVLLMFTIATNGGMGIEEEERQREGEGGHTTRTRSPILLVDGACSLLVGVVL